MQTSIATNWIVVTLSLLIPGTLIFLGMRLEYENRTQREQYRLKIQIGSLSHRLHEPVWYIPDQRVEGGR